MPSARKGVAAFRFEGVALSPEGAAAWDPV